MKNTVLTILRKRLEEIQAQITERWILDLRYGDLLRQRTEIQQAIDWVEALPEPPKEGEKL